MSDSLLFVSMCRFFFVSLLLHFFLLLCEVDIFQYAILIPLSFLFIYIFKIIFFVVVLGITINIIYISLVQTNINFISLIYKHLAHIQFHSFPLIRAVIIMQITSLCIICSSKQNYNYYFVWLSFKSDGTKMEL